LSGALPLRVSRRSSSSGLICTLSSNILTDLACIALFSSAPCRLYVVVDDVDAHRMPA
jgi:hypothetical protein